MGNETPRGNELPQNSRAKESLQVNFNGSQIELKGDNKLTKNELKAIESLLTGDRNDIIGQAKNDLTDLKNIIVKDLENRITRSPNKYISSLIERTKTLLDNKIATQTPVSTNDSATNGNSDNLVTGVNQTDSEQNTSSTTTEVQTNPEVPLTSETETVAQTPANTSNSTTTEVPDGIEVNSDNSVTGENQTGSEQIPEDTTNA